MTQGADRLERELFSVRDTVESIWVAIILAFVLRAFMIEAFVIPTGSMAPRLLGEHYDLGCRSCGWAFARGATNPERDGGTIVRRARRARPSDTVCPNCGRPYHGPKVRVNSGDRVLVMKYLYPFVDPKPWDVIVFRNPQDNRQNYIKRLIGLPGETIELIHGDVFVKDKGQKHFRIRRKDDPRIQEAMWQIIHDNDYRPDDGRPPGRRDRRWKPEPGADAWNLAPRGGRQFVFGGCKPGQWQAIRFEAPGAVFMPHYGYNPNSSETQGLLKPYDACSDLKLAVEFVPASRQARLALLLTSFEHAFKGTVAADGTVELLHAKTSTGPLKWQPWRDPKKLEAPLALDRGHSVALTHADFRVTLWVNGRAVLDRPYEADADQLRRTMKEAMRTWNSLANRRTDSPPAPADYYEQARCPTPAPQVRIAAAGGPHHLRHVRLWRDVYYVNAPLQGALQRDTVPGAAEYARQQNVPDDSGAGWGTIGNPITLKEHGNGKRHDLDAFLVLGDNSPQSLDSRAWTRAAPTLRLYPLGYKPTANGSEANRAKALYQLGTVPRYNLIGKALLVYWPAGFGLPGWSFLPIVPNVGRMRLIR